MIRHGGLWLLACGLILLTWPGLSVAADGTGFALVKVASGPSAPDADVPAKSSDARASSQQDTQRLESLTDSKPARSFREAMIERTLDSLHSSRPVLPLEAAKARLEARALGGHVRKQQPSKEFFIEQTLRQLEAPVYRSGDCCPCFTAPSCDDGLYCNGQETCIAGACRPGNSPCGDANPCTDDSCSENTDTCFYSPVAPPNDVAQLDVGTGATSTIAALDWSSVAGAVSYNVYRASSSELSDVACFQAEVTGTTEQDGAIPVGAFFYLVTAESICAESTLGSGNPNSRPSPPVCNP